MEHKPFNKGAAKGMVLAVLAQETKRRHEEMMAI